MNYPLYNNALCPKIWNINEDGPKLDNEVRKNLIKISMDFVKDLKTNNNLDVKIEDIVMIGSLTNYNWTPYSDVDLHIITDYSRLDMSKEDAQTMFDAIKANWNSKHDIMMKEHDVELYVQDKDYEPVSASEYSVLKNEWLKEPVKEKPNFNKKLIKKKYDEYKSKISKLSNEKDVVGLKKLLDKLYKFRQAGLDKGGELSEENIVFKILRAKGHLDKIKDGMTKIYDKKMSVDEGLFSNMFGSPDTIKYGVDSYDGGRHYNVTKDGKQIGSARVEDSNDGNSILLDIWVKSSHRNLGIGKKLMDMILKKEKKTIKLEPSDQMTKDWYTRLGFVPTGEGNWMELKIKDGVTKIYNDKMSIDESDSQITISKGGYKLDVQKVANAILDYAKEHGEYPDINPLLNPLVIRYNKNIDDVHHDVTKAFRRLTSILIEKAS